MHNPIRFLHDRACQWKNRLPIGRKQSPISTDDTFELALPWLIKGFDNVVVEAVAVDDRYHVTNKFSFVDHTRNSHAPLAPDTRPA